MISKNIKSLCKDYTKIENFEEAITSKQLWECHHRLETHFKNGNLRDPKKFITREELIEKNLYYDRPPEELIFLTRSLHRKLHFQKKSICNKIRKANLGKKLSNDTKKKVSENCKGLNTRVKSEARIYWIENCMYDTFKSTLAKMEEAGYPISHNSVSRWRAEAEKDNRLGETFYVGSPDGNDWRYKFAFDLEKKGIVYMTKTITDGIPGIEWEGFYFKVIKMPRNKEDDFELNSLLGYLDEEED